MTMRSGDIDDQRRKRSYDSYADFDRFDEEREADGGAGYGGWDTGDRGASGRRATRSADYGGYGTRGNAGWQNSAAGAGGSSRASGAGARSSKYDAWERYDAEEMPASNERGSGYRRSQGTGSRGSSPRTLSERERDHFDEEGRISSIYRPAEGRSRYSRASNRYTSANATRHREEEELEAQRVAEERSVSARRRMQRTQSEQPQDRRDRASAPYQQVQPQRGSNAARFGRDKYTRADGKGKAMSVSQQSFDSARRFKPVDSRVLIGLGAACAVLLLVIVIRFVTFGGVLSEYGSIKDQVSIQQTQLKEYEASSTEMQTQIDSWQTTIDTYNKRK